MVYVLGGIFGLWLFGASLFAWAVDLSAPIVRRGVPLSGWRSSLVLTLYIVTWPRTLYLFATGRAEVTTDDEEGR
jgi:hypothetical protein